MVGQMLVNIGSQYAAGGVLAKMSGAAEYGFRSWRSGSGREATDKEIIGPLMLTDFALRLRACSAGCPIPRLVRTSG